MGKPLIIETPEDAVVKLVLNRPAQLNAYTTEMCEMLVGAFEAYMRDDTRRVMILTGAGRGFCAGGDLSGGDKAHGALMQAQLSHAREMRDGMHRVVRALWACDKPVIASVNGVAVAGGLTLALACDWRIASDAARLGDTSGNAGLLPDEGGAWLFPRAMGFDKALKMTLLGEIYNAGEALGLGLVSEVVPAAELDARVMAFARALAARAPLAVRLAKSLMRRGLETTLDQSLHQAALSVMVANPSDDAREGVRAFVEKRKPQFKGV